MTPLRLASLIVMIGLSGLAASAAAAAEGPPTASYDDLLLLGDAVEAAQSYRDNFYLHEQWANACGRRPKRSSIRRSSGPQR